MIVRKAAPDGALWALSIASQFRGASPSSIEPDDLRAALSWGLVQKSPHGRRVTPTEAGWDVLAAVNRTEAKQDT